MGDVKVIAAQEVQMGNDVWIAGLNAGEVARQYYELTRSRAVQSGAHPGPVVALMDAQAVELRDADNLNRRAAAVILNLDDLAHVRLSNHLSCRLYWVSTRDPAGSLGRLNDEFQGVFCSGSADAELVFNGPDGVRSFRLKDGQKPTVELAYAYALASLKGVGVRLAHHGLTTTSESRVGPHRPTTDQQARNL